MYGPHMPRDTPYSGVAAIFRSALENGTIPNIYEDGGQMRDFVHVDDVAAANVAAVESDIGGFGAFNVCSGHPIDIGDVAGLLCAARGAQPPVVTGQHRNGDVRHIVADPARAAENSDSPHRSTRGRGCVTSRLRPCELDLTSTASCNPGGYLQIEVALGCAGPHR
ncbi:NAD dependent epimerase/dehydratase family protein [Mycobacterium kansasii 824]|nr:NAD dependent epimerase/dehydratase family protein [Mycobacterium kansasii 824]